MALNEQPPEPVPVGYDHLSGPDLLDAGGALVMKVLEGEVYPDLLRRARRGFERVKGFKPKASRGVSTEMYVIAEGYQPATDVQTPDQPSATADESATALPQGRPSPGWGHQT